MIETFGALNLIYLNPKVLQTFVAPTPRNTGTKAWNPFKTTSFGEALGAPNVFSKPDNKGQKTWILRKTTSILPPQP